MYHPLLKNTVLTPFEGLILKIKTDNDGTSDDDQFNLPTVSGLTYDYVVDWGDGTTNHYTSGTDKTHTYPAIGTYKVRISGVFPTLKFVSSYDEMKLLDVSQWGNIEWQALTASFYGCSNCLFSARDTPNTSAVTDMSSAFKGCDLLNSPSLVKLDTSSVENMEEMFYGCANFDQDISGFDISQLVDAKDMLYDDYDNMAWSRANYDKMLVAWQNKTHQTDVSFACNAKYTAGSAAETARNTLINTDGWTITDDGSY